MITKRSQKITSRSRQKIYYSDFTMDFDLNPVTSALIRLTNEDSVKNSIRNIVMTQQGERFYSRLGSTVPKSLFEPNDPISMSKAQSSIMEAIKNYEPRASNVQCNVTSSQDLNAYVIDLSFGIINIPNQIFQVSIINRIR